MKNIYTKPKRIHPSPQSPSPSISDHLSLLPSAILALTITLSVSDKEVLAYLISCSGHPKSLKATAAGDRDHPSSFDCDCFRCYTTYWARWNTSANQQLIHKIIDAYEDSLFMKTNFKGKKDRKKDRKKRSQSLRVESSESGELESVEVSSLCEENGGDSEGSFRKICRFIGERSWGVWGI